MSKYDLLWQFISKSGSQTLKLSFEDIKDVCGAELDHSFLNYKKDLLPYGYEVKKISLKEKYIIFNKT